MNPILFSRRTLLAGAGALATTTPGVPAFAQDSRPFSKWFKYNPELERSWSFQSVGDDANRVLIRVLGFESREASKVLVLYPRASSAYDIAISKVLDVLDDKELKLEIDVVNYLGDSERAKSTLKEAEKSGVSLIVSMGSESTAWLWQYYRGGQIPVVTVCSKDPVSLGQVRNYDSGSGTNFAFTSLNMPIEAQMAYVLQVKPQMKNIGVLVDSTNVSAVETQAKPVAEYANARGIRVLQLAVKDPKNVREELDRMVKQAVSAMQRTDPTLRNSVFWITGSTSVFDEIGTINREAGNVPVLSVVPEVVRAGDDSAALSIGVSFESNAHLAAIYAADLLEKKVDAGGLKVGLVSPPDIAINFKRAKAIGLRIPFNIFESAATIYDYEGRAARVNGVSVSKKT
jgi:putative ABC transport system substrate-binding protein